MVSNNNRAMTIYVSVKCGNIFIDNTHNERTDIEVT